MEVRATYKYAKISPFKAREITREIQGLPVSAALDVVAYSPKKAAVLINKTLKSAVANAENNANLKVDGLVVKEASQEIIMYGHSKRREAESKNPEEVTLKVSRRDPSVRAGLAFSLGMTE